MTNNQYIDKTLLEYKAELEGMIAENRQREIRGFDPAFVERHFQELMFRYHNAIMDSEE